MFATPFGNQVTSGAGRTFTQLKSWVVREADSDNDRNERESLLVGELRREKLGCRSDGIKRSNFCSVICDAVRVTTIKCADIKDRDVRRDKSTSLSNYGNECKLRLHSSLVVNGQRDRHQPDLWENDVIAEVCTQCGVNGVFRLNDFTAFP